MLVVSDYERNKYIWRVPIEAIRSLFLIASEDYAKDIRYIWDEKRQDFNVTVN